VLAGDHIYKMDYACMLYEHVERDADVSVACVEVPPEEARGSSGVMEVDDEYRVVGFEEKPAKPKLGPGRGGQALGSMGVYVFNADFLYAELERDAADPRVRARLRQGRDPAPGAQRRAHLRPPPAGQLHAAERRAPYWRDVGTIDAFWEANLELTQVSPPLNLYDKSWPCGRTRNSCRRRSSSSTSRTAAAPAVDSMVSGGCIVSGSTLKNSILFSSVRVHSYCDISEAVVLPEVTIGRGAKLKRVVIDQGCRIPEGLVAGHDPHRRPQAISRDRQRHYPDHSKHAGAISDAPALEQKKRGMTAFTDNDIYLFKEGTHARLYRGMGCHLAPKRGARFAVWAPNAKAVHVVGDWNGWRHGADELKPRWDHSGIWEGVAEGVERGHSVQVRDHQRPGPRRAARRPVRRLFRDRARHRLARVVARVRLGRRGLDGHAQGGQRPRRRRARSTRSTWFMAPARVERAPHLPRHRRAARRIRARDGLHARRADADHRASVLRLVGLPDHGLLSRPPPATARRRISCTWSTRCTATAWA
jgi:ADP-glucose pyrophosphorylase